MHTTIEIDPVLVERFARGNGTIFVGAGVSLGARLPTWGKLMQPLCIDLGIDPTARMNFLEIAELYEVKHSRSVLVHYLKEQLGNVKFQLTRTHELIVGLPVQRIYTTNFDTLLEQASQKKQINRNVIFNASHVGLSDTSTLSIVKLHGDLADPDSIVITARDFYSYFGRNPAVADLLKVELQTRTVLFLGYSFSDPNLGMILGNAASQSGTTRPLTYTIQFQPDELAVRALNARGLKVIPIDAPSGKPEADAQMEHWLQCFRQALISYERRRSHHPPLRQLLIESGASLRNKHAVRRERMSERMRAGLASDFRVIVVKGEPGIGKTQLTVEAASERLQLNGSAFMNEVFEMVVWIRPPVHGTCAGHTLTNIFRTIANKVDAIVETGNDDENALSTKINAILQERRLLVVIEDFDDPAAGAAAERSKYSTHQQQQRPQKQFDDIKNWLEHSGAYANPRSRIIVTSRNAIVAGFVIEMARLSDAEAIEVLRAHARQIMLRGSISQMPDEGVIIKFSMGNPQAIRLALGLVNGSGGCTALHVAIEAAKAAPGGIDSVFDALIEHIWNSLDPRQHPIIIAMLVFPTEEWVPAHLLLRAAFERTDAGADNASFISQVQHCVRFGLLEYDPCRNMFSMHRICKEVLLRKGHAGPGEPATLGSARDRLATYLIEFLSGEDVVVRPKLEPYWNALVRDEMTRVDQYWPTIESVMWSAVGTRRIVDFILLLVHYMDSRFLNSQRLQFVEHAIAELAKSGDRRTIALLRIDALGWTYIEEGSNKLAQEQIDKGITDADDDLKALAYAWKARISASEGKRVEAHKHISLAINYAEACHDKPWIGSRVQMMNGDVLLIDGDARAAEQAYLDAEAKQERYGGELGYQTDPRIGFALLAQEFGTPTEQNTATDKAERRFMNLTENQHLAIGRLYGEYGLALIAARRHATREAERQLLRILKEIETRRGHNNVLFKLATQSYRDIMAGKRQPAHQETTTQADPVAEAR